MKEGPDVRLVRGERVQICSLCLANSRAPLKTVAILCLRSVGINLDTHTDAMYLNADLQYSISQRLHYRTSLITLHDVRGSFFFLYFFR